MKAESVILKLSIAVAIIVSVSLISCKKFEGPKGDQGAQGNPGTNGSSNININDTIVVNTWTLNGTGWQATYTVPAITQEVFDKGLVSVFIRSSWNNQYWSLPDINGVNSMQFGYGVGVISFFNVDSDGSATPNPGTRTFKYIIVSPGKRAANPNVNWKNYAEVTKALQLTE